MATAITTATLFGSESKIRVDNEGPIVSQQEDGVPGMTNAVFVTSLGQQGYAANFSGYLRTGAVASNSLAFTAFNSIVTTIQTHWANGTLLDLFSGESSSIRTIYADGQVWRGVIIGFQVGDRAYAREGSNVRIIAPFTLTFRIQAKV